MKWRSLQESGAYSDVRTLGEILAERREAIARYVPAHVQAVHDRAVAGLKAEGLAGKALGVGAQAPAFELLDHDGRRVSSEQLLATGRLVVSFIRGRWCPICVGQMEAMSSIAGAVEAAGA
ncbi:MAG: redoxin domain-containing protein, partial [Terriglobales bacterium]